MQSSNFPPQAYTKETISEAFTWLQSQPEDVKKRATGTTQLVSLYLRAKSQQYWTSEANSPVQKSHSDSQFKDQLQKMALDSLSSPLPSSPPPQDKNLHSLTVSSVDPAENYLNGHNSSHNGHEIYKEHHNGINRVHKPLDHSATTKAKESSYTSEVTSDQNTSSLNSNDYLNNKNDHVNRQQSINEQNPSSSSLEKTLDEKSLKWLQETKTKFNLSSYKETLRLLIALGFERVRHLCHPKYTIVQSEPKD